MNLLSTTILGIFLSLKHAVAEVNVTETSSAPDAETTQLYTTEVGAVLADLTAPIGASDPFSGCVNEFVESLNDGEGIAITLCGYLEDGKSMVGIQLDLPTDRWVAVGFVLTDDFNAENPMTGVYAVIIPYQERNTIHERVLAGEGDIGTQLTDTFNVHSDTFEEGWRELQLTRLVTITLDDLGTDGATDVDKYFDFDEFKKCKDAIKVIYAFGQNANEQFGPSSYHGLNNAGVKDAELSFVDGESCTLEDDVNKVSIIWAVFISIIALLFNE